MEQLPEYYATIIGDGNCGKTSLLWKYAENRFINEYSPTVVDFVKKKVDLTNGKAFNLTIWDTAGQEDYRALRTIAYREARLVILAFAIDSVVSMQNIEALWWPEAKWYATAGCPMILVGLKSDLRSTSSHGLRIVSALEGQRQAAELGNIPYVECSALTGHNVDNVFHIVVSTLLHPPKAVRRKGKRCVIM
ncbi:P-loop containing nucleoside triphosphate hydrolase protein [Lipomyces arxii]|uniref:P-loop containing nucleoside triphosphate hydrolase protein n=1 Tax=Lipomyces arxii TaxID=56418 RepID=UPI0034CD3794